MDSSVRGLWLVARVLGAALTLVGASLGAAATPATADPGPEQPGRTLRVSIGLSGQQLPGYSGSPLLSGNGRYVVWHSTRSGARGTVARTFRTDRTTGEVRQVAGPPPSWVNASPVGSAVPQGVSADGSKVLVSTLAGWDSADTNGSRDLYLVDLTGATRTRVSVDATGAQIPAGGDHGSLDASGTSVVFLENHVPFGQGQIRLWRDGTSAVISTNPAGEATTSLLGDPTISPAGDTVHWSAEGGDLLPSMPEGVRVPVLHTVASGETRALDSAAPNAGAFGFDGGEWSSDARFEVINTAPDGTTATSPAPRVMTLVDHATGLRRRVMDHLAFPAACTDGQGSWSEWSLSADHRALTYTRVTSVRVIASEFPGEDPACRAIAQVRRLNLLTGADRLVSVNWTATPGQQHPAVFSNGLAQAPSISSDGSVIAYSSWAPNLVPHDTNRTGDIFVRRQGDPAREGAVVPRFSTRTSARLVDATLGPRQRPVVVLRVRGVRDPRGPGGTVRVRIGPHARTLTPRADGTARVRMPRLPSGRYRVVVRFAGSDRALGSAAPVKVLRVR